MKYKLFMEIEAGIMKDVPDWQVGKSVYHNTNMRTQLI